MVPKQTIISKTQQARRREEKVKHRELILIPVEMNMTITSDLNVDIFEKTLDF